MVHDDDHPIFGSGRDAELTGKPYHEMAAMILGREHYSLSKFVQIWLTGRANRHRHCTARGDQAY